MCIITNFSHPLVSLYIPNYNITELLFRHKDTKNYSNINCQHLKQVRQKRKKYIESVNVTYFYDLVEIHIYRDFVKTE